MHIARIGTGLILVVFCMCLQAHTQKQKITVIGKLVRVAAIGGETTGWAIQPDSAITLDGKHVESVEVEYHKAGTPERLENKRVKATGKLSHRHGVETGHRHLLNISSIKGAEKK